ncbi:MAG: C40 family peptidase [Acidimicrobiales bacterium]
MFATVSLGDRRRRDCRRGRRLSLVGVLSVAALAIGVPTTASAQAAPPAPVVPLVGASPATPEMAVPPIPLVDTGITDGQDPGQLLARAIALLTAGDKAGPLQSALSTLQATEDADTVIAGRAQATAAASTAASTAAATRATEASASAGSTAHRADGADQSAHQLNVDATSLGTALRQAALDLYMNGGAPHVAPLPVGRNVDGDAVMDAMVGEQVALSPQGILAAQRRAAATASRAAIAAKADKVAAQAAAVVAHAAAVAAQRAATAAQDDATRTSQAVDASGRQASALRQELSALDAATAATLGTEATTVAHQAGQSLTSAMSLQFAPAAPLPAPVPTTTVALAWAFSELGKTYVWGGSGPDIFDCSGLTQYSWNKAGMTIPRVAIDQYSYTVPVPLSDLRPGDLVFFGTDVHHVGMYIGDGLMINAPHTGSVVSIAPIWWSDLLGFGRVHTATTPVPAHTPPASGAVTGGLGTVPSQATPPPGAPPITEPPLSTVPASTPTTTRSTPTTKPGR